MKAFLSMSALHRHLQCKRVMSALPPKADLCGATRGVRWAKSGHQLPYSITSSARAMSVGGKVRARLLAVERLMDRANLVGCITGRSEGLLALENAAGIHASPDLFSPQPKLA